MGETEVTTFCYADDAVLIAENEDDLQRLFQQFIQVANALYMKIWGSKSKRITNSETPISMALRPQVTQIPKQR